MRFGSARFGKWVRLSSFTLHAAGRCSASVRAKINHVTLTL